MSSRDLLYLSLADVTLACQEFDVVDAIREVLCLHAEGQTTLPAEAYLAWTGAGPGQARSLNMPGLVGGKVRAVGTKIINANTANRAGGLPRASGLTLLFDPDTARPVCIMEGAFLSAQRTASVTILAVQHLSAPGAARAGLIGAGAQASAHLGLLLSRLTGFTEVSVFDHDEDRAHELCQAHALAAKEHAVSLSVVRSAQQAVEGADLIIPLTTTTEGYIPHAWLKPGAVLVNVSLDDCLPDVAMDAGLVVVDDWGLIKDDERRLLGRLFREGRICGPEEALAGRRMVDATLGDLIVGRHPGRTGPEQIILVNPFGMAIGDVMLAKATYDSAEQLGIGLTLPFDTLEA